MEMEVTTPNWSRTIKMDMWTKGLDYSFVRINAPRKDKGVSSLKRDKDMWNFFPKINKVIKIPPSMMMGSWMGSDFTNDDLVKDSSLIDDYKAVFSDLKKDIVTITLTPSKNMASLWGKILIFVDKKSMLPTKQEFFDEKGVKIRVMYFKDVKLMGGRMIPATLELIPLTKSKKGNKTLIRYIEAKFDVDVPNSVFTRTNLQKRR